MTIDFSPLIDEIRAHAAESVPAECCGLVSVVSGHLVYVRCRNAYAGESVRLGDAKPFEIHHEDYSAAEDAGEIVAIVHSHVGEPPVPSMADRVGIEAHGLPWLIVNYPVGNWTVNEPTGYKAPLIGRPYVHGVFDCFAICRDYYRETLGIEIQNYPRDECFWKKGQNLYLDLFEEAGFVLIEEKDLRKHDGIFMMVRADVPNHAAVYLGDDMILHHPMSRLSGRDPWGGYWKKCATHFVRHRSLA